MDNDESTMFAKKYKRDLQEITTEITNIIKQIITVIAEENKKLKNDLETVHKRIDDLKSLVIDMSTRKEKKKDFMSIKLGRK